MDEYRKWGQGRKWLCVVSSAFVLSALLSGCVHNPGDTQNNSLNKYSGTVKVKSLGQTQAEEQAAPSVVPIARIHNTDYVSLSDVAKAIGLNGEWTQGNTFGIGDRDPTWTFQTGDSKADNGEQKVNMPAPAVKQGDQLYAPVSALNNLFGNAANFRSDGNSVSFYPQPAGPGNGADDLALPIGDGTPSPGGASPGAGDGFQMQSASGSAGALIREAEKYMGVKYDFGAEPYSQSRKFDCSSFTQYIYGKFGVDLPRTARAQAKVGRSVSRSSLQPGDLVFFSVPGRFKSDNIVGHVGIYMGGGDMINANNVPKDGVQIIDITKEYWRDAYLGARRVL